MNLPELICVLLSLAAFSTASSSYRQLLPEGDCATADGWCCSEQWRYYTYPEDFSEGTRPPKCNKLSPRMPTAFYANEQCNATHCYCTSIHGQRVGDKAAKIGERLNCQLNPAAFKPKKTDIMINGVCRDNRDLPCCKSSWKAYDGDMMAQYRCDENGYFKPRQCTEMRGCYCASKNEPNAIPNSFAEFPNRTKCAGNACKDIVCQNGGACKNLMNQYQCSCKDGFKGKHCEINVDECYSDPCINNGICIDGINSYTCNCLPGWTGKNCQDDVNECKDIVCQNGGACKNLRNQYQCSCKDGFNGKNCEVNIDECYSDPCQNNGICIDGINTYTCKCSADWTGKNCQYRRRITAAKCSKSDQEKELNLECKNGGTIEIVEAFYGCWKSSIERCSYTSGDCKRDAEYAGGCNGRSSCIVGVDKSSPMFWCGCYHDYLQIQYDCV